MQPVETTSVAPPGRYVSQAPPRHTPREITVSTLTSAVALLALLAVGKLIGETVLIPPLAASAALMASATMTHLGQPRAVIGGQLVSALTGFLCLALAGSSPWVAAVAGALALASMLVLRVAHSPGAGTAVIVVLTHPGFARFTLLLLLATLILVLVGVVSARLNRGIYPDYWW